MTTPDELLDILAGTEPAYVQELRREIEALRTTVAVLQMRMSALEQAPNPPRIKTVIRTGPDFTFTDSLTIDDEFARRR